MRRKLPALALLLVLLGAFFALPVAVPERPTSVVVTDADGVLLGATVAADEQWRFPTSEAGVPPRYAAALLAFEDRRFHWHPGVDPVAVLRAMRDNLAEGRVVSGASTLTMQLVRLSRDDPPRTLPHKLLEMLLALRLEAALSKKEILSLYADNAPFGGNTVGLEAASRRYFGRPAGELSWAEAATLAVLPNAPALIHPGRNRDALRTKRDRLLDALVVAGHLSADDARLAKAEELPGTPRAVPGQVPHLLEAALIAHPRGALVQATVDRQTQRAMNALVARHHSQLAAQRIGNLAILVVENATGRVLAYVGNAPGAPAQHVDIVQSRRSTGSLLKPFLYAALLEAGELLPHQLVPDVPTRFGGFSPENFDRAYTGALPASQALARSRNVPATWMLRQYGVDRFKARLQALGMTTLFRPAQDYGLALILGGAEGTLWEMVAMYRELSLSAQGATAPATHWHGPPSAPVAPRIDPAAATLTLEALLEVSRPGAEGAWRAYSSSRKVAWKTGTSFGFRDAWAIGTTPELTVGVWVGNASGEGRPELTGLSVAAPVLFEALGRLPATTWFAEDAAGMVSVEVCAESGLLAGLDCAHTRLERTTRAGQHGATCGYCQRIHCDAASCTERLHAGCAELSEMQAQSWFVLPPAMGAYLASRDSGYRSPPPWRPGCAPPEGDQPLSVVTPSAGATVYVPVEVGGERGRVVFEAAHDQQQTAIHWHLDEGYVGTTRGHHQLALAPAPGDHRLTLVDEAGARVEHPFTVLDRGENRR